jgi:ankyrin repeat protein
MLRDIDNQNWEYAHRLFQIVAAPSRPLRVEELAEFLAFDFSVESTPTLLADWRPEDPTHAALSTCSSLLSVIDVDDSSVIQFSHFSVKEYLTSERLAEELDSVSRFHVSMTPAHMIIAQACLGALLHIDENVTEDDLKDFPLAEYAAEHWVGHARFEGVSHNIQDGMKRLFDPNKRHFVAWVWIFDPEVRQYKRPERMSPARATPLHYAAFCGIHEILEFLIVERLQDVNAYGFSVEETPLAVVSREGHSNVARVLLRHGANIEVRDKYDWSPLDLASRGGHVGIVRMLLEHGANVKILDKDNYTALHLASGSGHSVVVRMLLEHGADANAKRNDEQTPLHLANNLEVAQVLLEYGADTNARDSNNQTPLHRLADKDKGRARVFLENGADPNARDSDNQTPLHHAADEGVALELLEYGADPNAKDSNNCTPLHRALAWHRPDVARVLLENCADARSLDTKSKTPLHLASRRGYLNIVRLLLQRNSDVHAVDVKGQTPFQVASKYKHHDIMQVLLEHGG